MSKIKNWGIRTGKIPSTYSLGGQHVAVPGKEFPLIPDKICYKCRELHGMYDMGWPAEVKQCDYCYKTKPCIPVAR